LDGFSKLKPESMKKLHYLLRTKGIGAVARILHTSQVTIENVSSSLGGAKRSTVVRIEAMLAQEVPDEKA
jgi:hypothetical protein